MSRITHRGTRLIVSLWRQQKARFYCISTKTAAGKWKDHFFEKEDFGDIPEFLEDHEGEDIYFCPHGFKARARQKEEAVLPKMCWADLDEADPRKFKHMKPTIAIESSPGRFVGLWLLDRTVTENLNKRLSYQLGADKGGWDVTQVLRFPGTVNFKYRTRPEVRILWSDGDEYEFAEIDRRCADLDEEDEETGQSARDILKKYGKKMRPATRRSFVSPVTNGTDRSAVIWKMVKECIEVGMTEEETHILMASTPICKSKYEGRNITKALNSQIEKAVREKLSGSPKVSKAERDDEDDDDDQEFERIELTPLSDVKREQVEWLWDRRIAMNSLTIVEGPPGLGKSYVMHMVAKCVLDGDRIHSDRPSGFKPRRGRVLALDLENDDASVVKPRLEDNGCENLSDIAVVRKMLPLDEDDSLEALHDAIRRWKPMLVIFDTVSYFLGRASDNNPKEMAQMMGKLAEIAKKYGIAVVALRHWRKSSGDGATATDKGAGAITIAGGARVVLAVSKTGDPDLDEEGWRVVSVSKINVGGRAKGLLFRINERKGGRSEFEWGDAYDLSADEIVTKLGRPARDKDKEDKAARDGAKSARSEAEAMLRRRLANGGIEDWDKLVSIADKRGIDAGTLKSVAEKIGCEFKNGDVRLKPLKKD